MKLLYGAGTTMEDRKMMTPVVYSNTIGSMRVLLEQCKNLGYEEELGDKEAAELVNTCPDTDIDIQIGTAIKKLWEDPSACDGPRRVHAFNLTVPAGTAPLLTRDNSLYRPPPVTTPPSAIQKVWARRSEFQIVESMKYYFNKIDAIMQPDYLASDDDILFARVRTSGIVTERYIIDGTMFEMYDVGGQRNERKKWIHCFDNVTAIIFVAALSEYDQALFEDASTNRMMEAITLFKEICNNKYFANSSMLLFLNKKDLFAEKVRESGGVGGQRGSGSDCGLGLWHHQQSHTRFPASIHPQIWVKDIKGVEAFSDFPGPLGDYEGGVEYFLNRFLAMNEKPQV